MFVFGRLSDSSYAAREFVQCLFSVVYLTVTVTAREFEQCLFPVVHLTVDAQRVRLRSGCFLWKKKRIVERFIFCRIVQDNAELKTFAFPVLTSAG